MVSSCMEGVGDSQAYFIMSFKADANSTKLIQFDKYNVNIHPAVLNL